VVLRRVCRIESHDSLLVLTPLALVQAAADANDSIAAAAPEALESVVVNVPATPAGDSTR